MKYIIGVSNFNFIIRGLKNWAVYQVADRKARKKIIKARKKIIDHVGSPVQHKQYIAGLKSSHHTVEFGRWMFDFRCVLGEKSGLVFSGKIVLCEDDPELVGAGFPLLDHEVAGTTPNILIEHVKMAAEALTDEHRRNPKNFRLGKAVILVVALLFASSASATTISPTSWELSRGGNHELWTDGDVSHFAGWGSTNEGYPKHEVTWHFTIDEPQRVILDYVLSGRGVDYTVIEGNPSSVPLANIAGLFEGHWVGFSPYSYEQRLGESGRYSAVMPAGSYLVRGDLFGENIHSEWQLQAVNVPEPGTMQMVYGVAIGLLVYLLIRFAFPPEGGYKTWGDFRRERAEAKDMAEFDKHDAEIEEAVAYEAKFMDGVCMACDDEQLVFTSMVQTQLKGVMARRYECNNCGTAFVANYSLQNVARVTDAGIEIL